MNAIARDVLPADRRAARYARVVKQSKQNEWQVDRDVFRGRDFDFSRKFLPDGLSRVDRLPFLDDGERRLLSQVQGRTYAGMVGLFERFIGAKMLEQGRAHVTGNQSALEGLVRFSSEEIKHQEMFRRIEKVIGAAMPDGYRMVADPNEVAEAVLASSSWAVLALTCHIELFVQAHYEQSIAPRVEICPLYRDVFLHHWKDECHHVALDELEWTGEHARLSAEERDRAVDDLVRLIGVVDGILQAQAAADARYFATIARREFSEPERKAIDMAVLAAYRWQFIASGVQHVQFGRLLNGMTTNEQLQRIERALAPIMIG